MTKPRTLRELQAATPTPDPAAARQKHLWEVAQGAVTEEDVAEIMKVAVQKAKDGNMQAMRFVIHDTVKPQQAAPQTVHVGDVHDNRGTTVNNYFLTDLRSRAVYAIGGSPNGAVTVKFLMQQLGVERKDVADVLLYEWFDWQPRKELVSLSTEGKKELLVLNAAANGAAE